MNIPNKLSFKDTPYDMFKLFTELESILDVQLSGKQKIEIEDLLNVELKRLFATVVSKTVEDIIEDAKQEGWDECAEDVASSLNHII